MTAMREPTFLILSALASGPLHGYGVIREVSTISAGRVTMLPGTLYTALDRLSAQGLVELDREEVVDGRFRRYYRLANAGLEALNAEVVRLRQLATAVEKRLRPVKPQTA